MTDDQNTPDLTPEATPEKPAEADRIAKVMARAGVASRREAERMIIEGRVTVNGKKIDSPALDVLPTDKITVDGKKLDEPQDTRLWLYYKPVGLVTSEADEKGRQTVFDALPRDLPRVMSVGRLDLNSEGLLLLTNDGELKRRLELPETGWLRRYRVRVNGQPNDLTFAPLRRGVTIDGEEFAPMEIKLDSQQGANAWLTVGIREGKNREIRRAMSHVGLQVNRLIRIGYGPFKLTGLEPNQVNEVKRRVLRDQLGGLLTGEVEEKERPFRARGAEDGRDGDRRGSGKPFRSGDAEERPQGGRRFGGRDGADKSRPFARRADDSRGGSPRDGTDGKRRPFARRDGSDRPRKPFGDTGDRPRKSFAGSEGGDRPRRAFGGAEGADRPRKSFGGGDGTDRPRKPSAGGEGADRPRKSRWDAARAEGDTDRGTRKPFGKRKDAERGSFSRGEGGTRPSRDGDGARKAFGGKTFGKRDGKPQFARSGDGAADGDAPRSRSFGGGESRGGAGKTGFKSGGKGPRSGTGSGPGRSPRQGGAGGSAPGRSGGPKPTTPRRPKG
ncbi:MAG: pseudouridine synthase [Paracoccus denitrificans]|uniref:Pseudouridine synthase n=1 Tax=Paracoccus denitrificans TaxID=266 RepID=A0A533IER6_PARDE|nr:MAG: pseudouridine synthase [Paracoccus denitrificans]